MDALLAWTIISVALSGTLVWGIFRWIPRVVEHTTQRIERAQEATRRSNELRRQAEERHMEDFRDAMAENKLAADMNRDLMRQLLEMRAAFITLSATYHPHSDRSL